MATTLSFPRIALIAALVLNAALLSACGGASSDSSTMPAAGASTASTVATGSAASTGTGSSTVAAPTLSGEGSATVTVGSLYSFKPTVGATPSTLTYSITNKPTWATFNVATGQLSGTPAAGNVGSFAGIVISATNGASTTTLAAFTISVVAAPTTSGTATLSWTPPTLNTDGTSLANLAGYFIYYGSSPDATANKIQLTNPGLTAYTVTGLSNGTTYFAISAYAASGAESALSTIGSKTI